MRVMRFFKGFIIIFFLTCISLNAEEKKNNELMNNLFSGNKGKVDETLAYLSKNKPQGLVSRFSSIILSNDDAGKKEIAIKALRLYPHRETTPYCIEILKKTGSFLIKKEIIDYLASAHDRQAVPLVINELENPFYTVRESAALTLKKIGDDRMFPFILRMMANPNPVYKIYALEAIYYLYDLRFYSHLIDMLKDENKSIRYYVLKCIEVNKLKEALPFVRNSALGDTSWEVRIKAIQILEYLADNASMQVLLNCLRDANREVRYYSSKALYKLQFRASAMPLSLSLFAESDDEIKEYIINTMIAINDAGGYKGIRKILLQDENYRIRILASYALGRIKSNWSSSILLEGKSDKSKEVRAEICNSLGFYYDNNILKELIAFVNNDPETYVRSAALFSIKKIGMKAAILPLFDRYTAEIDPIFKEQIRFVLRALIREAS